MGFEVRPARVGSGLLDAVLAESRDRQYARLMLEAVRSRESYRRGFYRNRGWVERGSMASIVYDF